MEQANKNPAPQRRQGMRPAAPDPAWLHNKTAKRLTASVAAVAVLAVCLCITSFALVYASVAPDGSLFQTGGVKISLNNGQPVIEEHELLLKPGMTVEKEFFLENQSAGDVYYKLYFDNIEGGLVDVLDVSIRDGDTVYFHGKASDLTKGKVGAAADTLKLHERKELAILFRFPEEDGNGVQDRYLSFDLKADAVQARNNPNRLFD